MDNGNDVDIIYLDFCKAFNKIPHGRLLKKLEKSEQRGSCPIRYTAKSICQGIKLQLDRYNIRSPPGKCPGDYPLSSLHK